MLRVLVYHRIAEPDDTPHLDPALVSATPETFHDQMSHLKRWYRPVTLSEVEDAFLRRSPLPPRAVHVTFDDAYRDFEEEAWPILRELGIPATVFVATAYADDPARAFWWDRFHQARQQGFRSNLFEVAVGDASVASPGSSRGGPDTGATRVLQRMAPEIEESTEPQMKRKQLHAVLKRLPHDVTEQLVDAACQDIGLTSPGRQNPAAVLSWDELRELQGQGVTFGAHTRNHVALPYVEPERARREIRQSLEDLDRELGDAPRALAYPYGAWNPSVARIAREEGCAMAFTTDDGMNERDHQDPFRLRRTNITPRTSSSIFAIRMLPWFASVDRWRHRHERNWN